MTSNAVSDLLKHPADIVDDQPKAGVAFARAKRVRPPHKAEYHKEYSVGAATVEIIEREIIRERLVGGRPCLTSRRLDGEPPLDDLGTEIFSVDTFASREVTAIFHKHGNFCGSVARW